jgi:hypothetical protein
VRWIPVLVLCAASVALPKAARAAVPIEVPQAAPPAGPPPISVPRIGGYVQVRPFAQERVGLTTYLIRARLGIEGPLPSRFTYRLLAEFQASAP